MPQEDDNCAYCNGDLCIQIVTQGDEYFSAPCGPFCTGCMSYHALHCEDCAKEFYLEYEGEES